MEQKAKARAISKTEPTRATQSTSASWNYSQFIKEANSFNRRFCADRSQRLPFIDNQTGVAQADCALWRTETERIRCQAQAANGGQLFSYPSRLLKRGNKKIFERKLVAGADADQSLFRLTTTSFVASNPTSESSNTSSSSSSFSPQPVRVKKLRNQEQSNLTSDTDRSLKTGGRGDLHHQQRPPRADSTGSHSFVDSDSRDQSSTGTSHSQESPRSQHLDDDLTYAVVDRHRLDYEERVQTARGSAEAADCFGIHLRQELKSHENVQLNSDWTNESIEQEREVLKSKLSCKRKNLGSSLIKSSAISNNNERSLLIKSNSKNTNGRKTTQNNCNSDSQNGIHFETADEKTATNQSRSTVSSSNSNGPKKGLVTPKCRPKLEADRTRDRFRPYVCPICDQAYKTRPGLSYHFIHAHDTVLPRNLPVKVQAGQEIPIRKETKRLNDEAVCRRAKPQAKKRRRKGVDEKLSARVLRRCRTTTTEDQDGVQSDGFAARQNRCQAIVAKFNESRRHQQPPDAASGLDDDQEPISAQAVAKRQSDDESKSHAIETTEPLPERAKTAEPPTSDVSKLDNDDNKDDDYDDDETVIGSNLSRSSSTESVASILPTPATDEIQNVGPDSVRSDRVDDEINNDDKTHATDELECESHTNKQQHDENSVKAPVKLNNRNRNLFCDFCLGTADRNRRTRLPESLISCSDCGSSGHPSCLRFSDNIRQSVQKYNWQCIECKTCSTCNQADHEDQLLFCDDCDRSYHTYCLSPRLERPPEGNWTCKRCLNEYYTE